MNKIIVPVLLGMLIFSCSKIPDPVPEITFTLNVSGFQITKDNFGEFKSTADEFSSFVHKYPTATITFVNEHDEIYNFTTDVPLDEYSFALPIGDYTISGTGGNREKLGDLAMALTIDQQQIIITESTTSVDITVTPTVSLFLVAEEGDQFDKAYINTEDYSFYPNGELHYIYFMPHSTTTIYIYKKDGGLYSSATSDLNNGYVYKIVLLDAGSSQSFNITPTFTEPGTIYF